jgi:hypothetical protein
MAEEERKYELRYGANSDLSRPVNLSFTLKLGTAGERIQNARPKAIDQKPTAGTKSLQAAQPETFPGDKHGSLKIVPT